MASRVRVYIACSLDGFIAGPDNDLSWLPGADGKPPADSAQDEGTLTYEAFMADVGAMLMGRTTHDVIAGFGAWPYGECPVLVATHRPLEPAAATVRAVSGPMAELVAEAKAVAGEGDVYLDGGSLIRAALDAGLVDEVCVTMAPVVLGRGAPLFAGCAERHRMTLVGHHRHVGGMVQLHLRAGPV